MYFYCRIFLPNSFTRGVINYSDEDIFAIIYTLNNITYVAIIDVLLNYIVGTNISYDIFQALYMSRAEKVIKINYLESDLNIVLSVIERLYLMFLPVNRNLMIIDLFLNGAQDNKFSEIVSDLPSYHSDTIYNKHAEYDESEFITIFCDLIKGDSDFRSWISLNRNMDMATLNLSLNALKSMLMFDKIEDIAEIRINDFVECLNMALESINLSGNIKQLEDYSTIRSTVIISEPYTKFEVTLDGSNLENLTKHEIIKLNKYLSTFDDPKYELLKSKVSALAVSA